MIDIHCHILPGLDDGARSPDEAIQMAQHAIKDGITKVVATPHLFRGNSRSLDPIRIEQERLRLMSYLRKKNLDIEIYSGAEVHISHDILAQIKEQSQDLTINRGSYLLVEFPSSHVFSNTKDLFFNLRSEGIIPIIAHPERNSVFRERSERLYELVLMGALVQANSGSFLGTYGMKVRDAVFRFLHANLIHFIGSDAHDISSLPINLSDSYELISTTVGNTVAEALFEHNPLAVIEDRELSICPEPIEPTTAARSLKVKVPKFLWKSH